MWKRPSSEVFFFFSKINNDTKSKSEGGEGGVMRKKNYQEVDFFVICILTLIKTLGLLIFLPSGVQQRESYFSLLKKK